MSGNVNSLFAVEKGGGVEGRLCLKATMTEVSLMPRNKTRISWGRGVGWGGGLVAAGGWGRGFLECNHGERS